MICVVAMLRGLVLLVPLAAVGCQADKPALDQLQQVQATTDPRVVVAEKVNCVAASAVCVRLLEEHGAACLRLTEAADPASRGAMRDCALHDFAAARAQMPADATADMKLIAARGLAQALVVDRDNTMDRARYTGDVAKLDAVVADLRALPGGAAYGAYFSANNALNRVLTGNVPAGRACATLAAARDGLVGVTPSGELVQRIAALRAQIDTAMHPPLRSCA